jgi:hypothetical protein
MDKYSHTELDEEAAAIAILPRMAKRERPAFKIQEVSTLQRLRRAKKEKPLREEKRNGTLAALHGQRMAF